MNKLIIPIIAVLIIAVVIGAFFIYQELARPEQDSQKLFSMKKEKNKSTTVKDSDNSGLSISKEMPFGLSNPLDEGIDILPEVLYDLGLSEKNGAAGFVVDAVARKNAEKCTDEDDSVAKYNFSVLDKLMDAVVGKGKSNLWIVISPVSNCKFRDGKVRQDGRTYLPDGPISRKAYQKYLAEFINHATAYGRSQSGNPDWYVIRWNLFNEVLSEWNQTFGKENAAAKYAEFVLDSAKVLRELSPKSKIVLGGLGSGTDLQEGSPNEAFYIKVFDHLRTANPDYVPFDFFESHWFSAYTDYGRNQKGLEIVREMQDFLKRHGYGDKQVIIRAGATYTGMDIDESRGLMDNLQSESQQAEFLFKRFIYNLAQGVRAIPWSLIIEHKKYYGDAHSIFNFTGLIYNGYPALKQCDPRRQQPCPDPGYGIKKLSYYTFKFLIEKTRGTDFSRIERINTAIPNVYLYKLRGRSNSLYVAWWDYFQDKDTGTQKTVKFLLSDIKTAQARVTDALPEFGDNFQTQTNRLNETDYPHFFSSKTLPVINSGITLTLGKAPVFIEEQ